MRPRWSIWSLGLLAAFCLTSNKSEAIFASVKSMGMASTAISYPLDSFAVAYNPAGIAEVGDRFDIEGVWLQDKGRSKISGNIFPLVGINGSYDGMRTKNFYWGNIGVVKDFCCNCFGFTLGLAAYNRYFQKTTYDRSFPLFGSTNLGSEYWNETISPTLAFWLGECHVFGISANYNIQRFKLNGFQNFNNILRSINPGHVTNRGYSYAHGWGWTAGWITWITDCLSVGVAYTPKTKMSRFHHYSGFLAERGRLDMPRRIGIGASLHLCPCFVIAFDTEFVEWKKVRSRANSITNDSGLLNLFGTNEGPGFGYKNQVYYRLGIEFCCNPCWTLRLGYQHAHSPIRRSQTLLNILTIDAVEDYAAVGLTWNLDFCNEFSIFYQYGFQRTIEGDESIPASLGGGEVDLREKKQLLGIAWSWLY